MPTSVPRGTTTISEPPATMVFVVFGRAFVSSAAYLETDIATHGIYLSDFYLLEMLLHKGPLGAAAIAKKLPSIAASLTTTADRLETLGYARRRRGRGTWIIELTQQGNRVIREAYRRHVANIERVLSPLSATERLQLYQMSRKIGLSADRLQLTRFEFRPGSLSQTQLRRATTYLSKHSASSPSVAEIAAKLGMSPSRFSRAFKTSTGFPPHRWQLNHRIAKAQELLREAGLPLAQIALATGFAEQSHFTRVFKSVVGVSPGTWQRDHRK
jgi:AraC-like DNA-binding protein/DNA-binding MarR family transcriptional regulator